MASHALLPVCFRRRELYAPSPEEAREIERRKRKDELDRLIAELRGEAAITLTEGSPNDRREALPSVTAKRKWIREQKLLVAEAMQQSGGPDPRWNDDGRERRHRRAEIEELSAAFEISKRRWMVAHKPSIAEDAESVPRETQQARPDHAKIERTVPAKSAGEKHLRGGRRRNDEYYAMRRQVLASYQFVTDKECEAGKPTGDEEEAKVPPRRDPLIPSAAKIKVSDVANAPPPGSAGAATMKVTTGAPWSAAAPIPPRTIPVHKGMTVKVRRLVGTLPPTGQRLVLWLSAVVVSDAEDGYVQVIYNGDDRFRAMRLAMDDVKHMPSITEN